MAYRRTIGRRSRHGGRDLPRKHALRLPTSATCAGRSAFSVLAPTLRSLSEVGLSRVTIQGAGKSGMRSCSITLSAIRSWFSSRLQSCGLSTSALVIRRLARSLRTVEFHRTSSALSARRSVRYGVYSVSPRTKRCNRTEYHYGFSVFIAPQALPHSSCRQFFKRVVGMAGEIASGEEVVDGTR